MSEPELREELLRQANFTPAEQELNLLRGLIDSEQRRTRRLGILALASWLAWPLCLAWMIILPALMARPAGQGPGPPLGAVPQFLLNLFTFTLFGGALVLPVVGLVSLVMYALAIRSPLTRSWLNTRGAGPSKQTT